MFTKFDKTSFPPNQKPILVWDGECGFCKFWVIHFKKKTGDSVAYRTYQEVASQFKDIPLKEFKKASRLIETDGKIYSGPDSAYRTLTHSNINSMWHRWYKNKPWFTWLSDHGYNHIAKNRSFYFKVTKLFFGKNPEGLKAYWLVYIVLLLLLCFGIVQFL